MTSQYDGHFRPEFGPPNLGPHDGVDFHDFVGKPVVVQERADLAAERTGLKLVQSKLQAQGVAVFVSWHLKGWRGEKMTKKSIVKLSKK